MAQDPCKSASYEFSRAIESFIDVNEQQLEQLRIYERLLIDWNSRMNLVSAGDLTRFWSRHCYESAQLIRFLPHDNLALTDLGSGAGFPALVLAILKPNLNVTLIESNARKASFLSHVSRETCCSTRVVNARIEELTLKKEIEAKAITSTEIVTARALASISKTLGWLQGWRIGQNSTEEESAHKNTRQIPRALLLKGSRWQDELAEAQKIWEIHTNVEYIKKFSKNSQNPQSNTDDTASKDAYRNSTKNTQENSTIVILKVWNWSRKKIKHRRKNKVITKIKKSKWLQNTNKA